MSPAVSKANYEPPMTSSNITSDLPTLIMKLFSHTIQAKARTLNRQLQKTQLAFCTIENLTVFQQEDDSTKKYFRDH